jgi:hypothetical protein
MGDTSDQRLASSAAMTTVAGALAQDGFARVSAEEMRALLGPEGLADWKGFADSWDGLGLDLWPMVAVTVGAGSGPLPCGKASFGAKRTSRTPEPRLQ